MMVGDYAQWTALLARARLGIGAAELHGSITGFLCCGWSGRPRELLASLALPEPAAGTGGDLEVLLGTAAGSIADRLQSGAAVELLLPEGPLAARVDAMVDWCRGFFGGFGLTGVLAGHAYDPAVRGLLDDLGQIAASHLDSGQGDAADLDDVLEFIRGGVAQLRAAFSPAPRP